MDISTVRGYCNLPANLADSFITKHLDNSKIEAENYLGTERYNAVLALGATNKEYKMLSEAVILITFSNMADFANTFYVEGIPSLNAEGAGVRYFSRPDIRSKITDSKKRAFSLLGSLIQRKFKTFNMISIGGDE